METVAITSQEEFDALPRKAAKKIVVVEFILKVKNERVILIGDSSAELWGNSRAELRGNSHAELRDHSHAVLLNNSHALLMNKSRAELRDNSSAELRGISGAELWNNSSAELWGNSHALLLNKSHAVLRDNSHAELWDISHALLWGNSRGELRDNSHGELRDHSRAELRDNSRAQVTSASSVVAFENSHVLYLEQPKSLRLFDNATVKAYLEPTYRKEHLITCERPIEGDDKTIALYKSVDPETSRDFYTGKYKYEIGKTIICEDFNPDPAINCGQGFHLCLTAREASRFNVGKYLKCYVNIDDIAVNPKSLEKVRCRAVTPVAVVDVWGREVEEC
jgi:hypothetical protein